jgi:putative FmdB family regulatory protein
MESTMPLLEFRCSECGTLFEEFFRPSDDRDDVACPECGSPEVERQLSAFAMRTGSGSDVAFGSGGSTGCGTGGFS